MTHDALVIGGGHDGLVAATLLARAGRKVVLCEARDQLGGRCAREEFHPGYHAPGLLQDADGLRPQVVSALDLERYGLGFHDHPHPVFSPAETGASLWRLPADGEMVGALRHVNEPDGWAWRRWREATTSLGGFLAGVLDREAPDPEPHGLSAGWELLRVGYGLRRLGARDMRELLRVGPMTVRDWLGEHFTTPRLSALLALPAVGGTWLGPWSAGSAMRLLMLEATRGPSVRGGPAAVISALQAAAKAAGVEIMTGASVTGLRCEQGAVKGASLADGRGVDTSLVLAAVEPKRALLELLPARTLSPKLADRLAHWRTRGTTAALRLALSGPVPWRHAGDQPVHRAHLADDLTAIERAFEGVKYRRLPERPVLEVAVPSLDDPGLAPEGHHVLTALVSYAPHDLSGGWTDDARRSLRDRAVAELSRHAPGLAERIVGEELLTPVDLEQRYGLTGGQLHHGEPALDQMLHLRPDPSCARSATPIDGLYLAGSGRHPGGGVDGTCGLLAAQAALAGGA
jgi:phytoene dehydrogenase-like protein